MIAAIEASAVSKRFGATWALHQCSIRLPAGKVIGLVGPNGAGKTTFLHLAAGLARPTEGEVKVLGRSPEQQLLLLDRVGFVAQETPLYPSFTVAAMLRFGRALNRRWDQRGAEARLNALGIGLNRRVGQLSGGQRAQVALAVALGKRPEMLLLDEPVARLDPLARREFLQGLAEAAAGDGMSVVLSSHLVADLERVCDYLVILAGGQFQASGEIDELLAAHHLLVGPRLADGQQPPGVEVVRAHHTDRQSSFWVRGPLPYLPAGWRREPLALEELVIAYLAAPEAGALPAPQLQEALT
ncbi:MAG TPA: ABC transporter ATP-binding protein [Candidatus Dormibacteraeota bacterium]